MGIPDPITCLLRNLYTGQQVTVRTGHGTMGWFKIRKGYVKAVYCHPAYLTYMQSTSCKKSAWISSSWNQDCREKYQVYRYTDKTTLIAETEEKLKSLLIKVKRRVKKVA